MKLKWPSDEGEEWSDFDQAETGQFSEIRLNGVVLPNVVAVDTDNFPHTVWLNIPSQSGQGFLVWDEVKQKNVVARAKLLGKVELIP